MTRNVGGMGESVFASWCHQEGLTFNRVVDDRGGWDYLVEFPFEEASVLDRAPGPAQLRIQVKATDRSDRRRSVKLSNWVRLVKSPLPAFFLVMEFDGTSRCKRAFLVHVGELEIRKVLKRLRELSAEGETGKLHKRTLDLTYSEENLLRSPGGNALVQGVREALGDDYDAYRAEKERLLREAGYEEVSARLDFTFKVPESHREGDAGEILVDFAIGAISKLEVVGTEVWDERFGIPVPALENLFTAGGELTVERKPLVEGILLLRSTRSGVETRVPACAYGPGGVAHLVDQSKWKVRIEVPGGSIVFAPNASTAQLNFSVPDPEGAEPLDHLADVARLLRFFGSLSGRFEVRLEDLQLGCCEIVDLQIPQAILDWCEIVLMAQEVARSFELPPDTAVPVTELWEHKTILDLVCRAIRSDTTDLSMSGSLAEPASLSSKICFPALHDLLFGPFRLLLGAAYIGPPPTEDPVQEFAFSVDEIRILRKQALKREEPLPAPGREILSGMAEPFEDSHEVVVWWTQEPGNGDGQVIE